MKDGVNSDTYDAGSPEQVEEARRLHKLERRKEQEDLRELLGSKQGKRVLWKILSYSQPMSQSFVPGGSKETYYYHEGRRSVGLWLIAQLSEADPLAYVNLQKENIEDD